MPFFTKLKNNPFSQKFQKYWPEKSGKIGLKKKG